MDDQQKKIFWVVLFLAIASILIIWAALGFNGALRVAVLIAQIIGTILATLALVFRMAAAVFPDREEEFKADAWQTMICLAAPVAIGSAIFTVVDLLIFISG